MSFYRQKSIYWLALSLILLMAAVMRFWGIDFGMPELLHKDEVFEISRTLRLGSGSFYFERAGKGGLYYILFLEMGLNAAYLFVTGAIDNMDQFAQWFVNHEHHYYLAGRVTCAVFSVLSVFLVYLLGKQINGRYAGLAAAFFMAFSAVAIHEAHFATVDNLLVLLLLCAWLCLFRLCQVASLKYFLLTGLFAGLSLITKLPAIGMLIPMLLCSFCCKKSAGGRLLKGMALMLLVFLAVTVVGEPGYLKNFGDRARGVAALFRSDVPTSSSEPSSAELDSSVGAQGKMELYHYYFGVLRQNVGWPLLIVFGLSSLAFVFLKNRYGLLLLSFIFPYFMAICLASTSLYHARYILPVLPLMYLVAASGLFGLAEKIRGLKNKRGCAIALMTCLVIFAPVYRHGLEAAEKFGLPNTRLLAKNWIEANCKASSVLLMEGGPEHRSQYMVPVYNQLKNIDQMITELKERDPGKAKYWSLKKEHLAQLDVPRFDIHFVMWDEPWPPFEEVKKSGVEYVIISAERFKGQGNNAFKPVIRSRVEFFQKLVQDFQSQKVAAFYKNGRHWGPELEIYRLTP